MIVSRLQYITPQYENESYFEDISRAIDAGVEWIQVRVKDLPQAQWEEVAGRAVALCHSRSVTCIVNDSPVVALRVGANGVHLGKGDMPPADAREMLGARYLIGGTANTIEDVGRLHSSGVDYIGLGPFKMTYTKKKLSPILGIEGYRTILSQCKERAIDTPIIAIGGIELDDIDSLMSTGVYGIAVSGLLSRAIDKADLVSKIHIKTRGGKLI